MQMKDDLLETREESHDVLSNKGERESCGEGQKDICLQEGKLHFQASIGALVSLK